MTASFCGFIDFQKGFLETITERWSTYVNEGIFSTTLHPPLNFGLLLHTIVISSVIFHSVIYLYLSDWFSKKYSVTFKKKICNEEKERKEWNSRVTSNVHAIISSLISLYCMIFVYQPVSINGILARSDTACTILLGYCAGYFIYDMIIVVKNYPHLGGMETVAHHIVSVLATLGSVVWEKCVVILVLMLFTEISTPFVNQRYFLAKCNMKDSKLYAYNGILMWLVFGIVRVSFCFLVPHMIWTDSETWCSFPIGWIILVTGLISTINSLNLFWFYKITMGVVQVVFPSKKSSSNALPSTSTQAKISTNKKQESAGNDDDDEDEEELNEKVATTLPLITRR